jgi:Ca2+-binding EF-hand superfamily protein
MALRDDLDKNGDGRISMVEFISAVQEKRKLVAGQTWVVDQRSLSSAWRMILSMAKGGDEWQALASKLFSDLDRDGSGEVDLRELAAGLQSLAKRQGRSALSSEQVAAFYKDLDTDASGVVSLSEFLAAAECYRPGTKAPELDAWRLLLQKARVLWVPVPSANAAF